MSLIKCSECNNEISSEAISCPKCGNPIKEINIKTQVINDPQRPFKVELELTSKRWKKVILIAWFIIIGGLLSVAYFASIMPDGHWVGFGIAFLGIIVLIIGKIGAWYSNR